ncbi:MAG TPA: hypothetical protein GXX37_11540 [Clostridiaceae bacterium]|nr:hypothetical protein [Clostridiaceae bacterium]
MLVSSIIGDIHSVSIPHQTVSISNYVNIAAVILKPFVDNYDYPLTVSISADETYIKVFG